MNKQTAYAGAGGCFLRELKMQDFFFSFQLGCRASRVLPSITSLTNMHDELGSCRVFHDALRCADKCCEICILWVYPALGRVSESSHMPLNDARGRLWLCWYSPEGSFQICHQIQASWQDLGGVWLVLFVNEAENEVKEGNNIIISVFNF